MNEFDDHYDEDAPSASLTQNKADGLSPGEILREARLSHDYTVADLCAQTKFSPKTVNALEDNDFAALSQPVFARGYYRQCAKVLDINQDRLMAAYSAWAGDAAARPASPSAVDVVPQDVTPQRWRALGLVAALLALLVVIGAVFVFLPDASLPDDNDGSDNTIILDDQSSDAGAEGATANDADVETSGDDGVATGGNASAPEAVSEAAGEQTTTGTDQPAGGRNVNDTLGLSDDDTDSDDTNGSAADEASNEPQIAPNHLVMEFEERSWVDVRDADGNRLLTGIYEAGDTQELEAPAPYRITLGFAPGVSMTIGGEPVDVAGATSGNSTARLTVEARESE